jgi:hypothetical protein
MTGSNLGKKKKGYNKLTVNIKFRHFIMNESIIKGKILRIRLDFYCICIRKVLKIRFGCYCVYTNYPFGMVYKLTYFWVLRST